MNIYKNKAGFNFTILSRDGKKCIIKFLDTNYVRECYLVNAMAGKVKDVYAKTRYGIGYMGDYTKYPFHKQAMQLWANVMKRCYSDNDPKGYKGEVVVDPRWHCYANFVDDIQHLNNFDKWLAKEGYQLDKDLINQEAKCYSRYTCSFVTEAENKSAGKLGKKLVNGCWVTTSA